MHFIGGILLVWFIYVVLTNIVTDGVEKGIEKENERIRDAELVRRVLEQRAKDKV